MHAFGRVMFHAAVATFAHVLLQRARGAKHGAHFARPAFPHVDGDMTPQPRIKLDSCGLAAQVGQRIKQRMAAQRHEMRQRAIGLHVRGADSRSRPQRLFAINGNDLGQARASCSAILLSCDLFDIIYAGQSPRLDKLLHGLPHQLNAGEAVFARATCAFAMQQAHTLCGVGVQAHD